MEEADGLLVGEGIPLQILQGKGERILVVEDDDGIRGLVENVLSENGYSGVVAKSSEEALENFGG